MNANKTAESTLILQQEVIPLVIGLLISLINLLAIVILFQCKKMNIHIRLLSMNLAFTDLMTGLAILVDSFLSPILPEGLCRLVLYLYCIGVVISFLTINAMLIDRLVALYFPFKYHNLLTREKCPVFIFVIWITGSVLTVVNYHDGFSIYETKDLTFCINAFVVGKTGLTIVTVFFCISLIIDLLFYLLMFIKIRGMTCPTQDGHPQRPFRQQVKILMKLLTITGTFMVLYTPQIVLNVIVLTSTSSLQKTVLNFQGLAGFLILFNSFINPFLYVWRFTECRYTLLIVVCYCNKARRQKYGNLKKQFYVSFLGNDSNTSDV